MEDAGDSADKQAEGVRRFAAFISYSHADADAAAKLQRKLERYRLPKRIAETRATKGAELGRIFRDREDFAAAVSLSAAIREAISQAEAMVVMCSRDASASPWVQAEIELFRQLHPGRPILAALLSGEPAVSFPAALTADGNEPLAADLRPGGDGEQLGFLKIVAGIAGVPLDELIQRDAQRRLRRVTVITAGALAAMLIMGIMTTLAIQARNEAARQRAAAEGLVEYMLTDLREKLKGVGRLDVMAGVNRRAKDYYGGTSIKGQMLEAQVLHAMGEDFDKQGKTDQAEHRFREAYQITWHLLASYPRNADAVFAHAQSEYWIGYIHYLRKDYRSAGLHWQNYKKYAERLATLPGERFRGAMEVGYANNNLCVLAVDSKHDPSKQVRRCGDAVSAQRNIATLNPDDPAASLSLANSIAWSADAHEAQGALQMAAEMRSEQLALLDRLIAKDPRNRDYAEFRLTTMTALARLDRKAGRFDHAHQRLLQARRTGIALKTHDPQNATWSDRLERIDKEIGKIREGSKQ